jgi:hypothetical protein
VRFSFFFSLSVIHTEVDRVAEVWTIDRGEKEGVKSLFYCMLCAAIYNIYYNLINMYIYIII